MSDDPQKPVVEPYTPTPTEDEKLRDELDAMGIPTDNMVFGEAVRITFPSRFPDRFVGKLEGDKLQLGERSFPSGLFLEEGDALELRVVDGVVQVTDIGSRNTPE